MATTILLSLIATYLSLSSGSDDSFDAYTSEPFIYKPNDVCGEPVYCSHTIEMQRRIQNWQDPVDCANAKFLIYEPPSRENGLGSMIQIIGSAFRQATCLGRRLYLLPNEMEADTLSRWMVSGCSKNSSSFECYFERITPCTLNPDDIISASISDGGFGIDAYPLRGKRIIRLVGLPANGPCSLCGDNWDSGVDFFDGLFIGELV
jgi:hypothetical protein